MTFRSIQIKTYKTPGPVPPVKASLWITLRFRLFFNTLNIAEHKEQNFNGAKEEF